MSKKAKAKAKTENPLDALFARAREQSLATARKRREQKTRNNILHVKKRINDQRDKRILQGKFQRHSISGQVLTEVCSCCKSRNQRVSRLSLIKASVVDPSFREIEALKSGAMFDLHRDLPINLQHHVEMIPRCVRCLIAESDNRRLQCAQS